VDWRLDDTGHCNTGSGPLSWLASIPPGLRDHSEWSGYLTARSELVAALADQVRASVADTDTPEWATQHGSAVPTRVLRDVQVWRAAMQVSPEDRRPTGPVQLQKAARTWQRHLDRQLAGDLRPALQEWGGLLDQVNPRVAKDEFAPVLADRLAAISRAGMDASQLLRSAASTGGPLPDDHAAAALWWRISRHLTPTVAAQVDTDHTRATTWTLQLAELLGAERADDLQSSRWWPPLVKAVDQAMQRGWQLNDLLGAAGSQGGSVDAGEALVWRISLLIDPIPSDELYEPFLDSAPPDMWPDTEPGAGTVSTARDEIAIPPSSVADMVIDDAASQDWVEPDLAVAALVRGVAGPPEQTDADVDRIFVRAIAWRECPVSRDKMIQINQMTLAYLRSHFPSSWGQAYLTDRFGQDLIDEPRFRPGQAPAGWTGLVHHLRRRGVTDQEMIATGVATLASTGRLIDRFRDRVVFPIIHNQEILGFVGRRHLNRTDADRGGPKYLNTADTPLFHKGAQLFGAVDEHLTAGGVPVIVEGPMDAIAVTLASGGRYIGDAPLCTSLTGIGKNPIVATDADIAGRVAAERDFWMLTPYRLDPRYAQLPEGSDPADLLARHGPAALVAALDRALPPGERLLDDQLTNLPPDQAEREATRVVAARPPASWDEGSSSISSRLNVPLPVVRQTLLAQVKDWNTNPRRAATKPLKGVNDVKSRLTGAAQIPPEQRWAALADQLDQRLLRQGDWLALAQLIQKVHDQGHDAAAITRRLITATPLNDLPAQDLRYRLVAHLGLGVDLPRPPVDTPTAKTTTHPGPRRKALASTVATTRTPPR
jgi:hypothetical protein